VRVARSVVAGGGIGGGIGGGTLGLKKYDGPAPGADDCCCCTSCVVAAGGMGGGTVGARGPLGARAALMLFCNDAAQLSKSSCRSARRAMTCLVRLLLKRNAPISVLKTA
jgi:hypothetical protein